ncbi:MAG: hypothetical protein IJK28_04785 [Clostridia bacterium]|nr:hypothetical protein [Clostridia bacterium]
MERKILNDQELELVTGGSIIFNEDCSTCGRKNNAEYKVLNFSAILQYVRDNRDKMPEKQMMVNMLQLGYITTNN